MRKLLSLLIAVFFSVNARADDVTDFFLSYVIHRDLEGVYETTMRRIGNTCGRDVVAGPSYTELFTFEPVGEWRFKALNGYRLAWNASPKVLLGFQYPEDFSRFVFNGAFRSGNVKGKRTKVSVDVLWTGEAHTYKIQYSAFRKNGRKCRLSYWGAF